VGEHTRGEGRTFLSTQEVKEDAGRHSGFVERMWAGTEGA